MSYLIGTYASKYIYNFKSFDGFDCEVRIQFKGYSGAVQYLDPGPRAFILREFNTDLDFYKFMRPMQAEMQILATPYISMDDFIADNDDDILVRFYFNGVLFWNGFLLQDDFQESWIDTNHIFTLRANDGLAQIDGDALPALSGQYTILEYLTLAIDSTAVQSFTVLPQSIRIINNLFYEGMDDHDAGDFTPLDQCSLESKTFQGDTTTKMLEKINRAWNMTLFQYQSRWWFVRMEEYLNNNILKGIVYNSFSGNSSFEKTFDVNIGVNETIKPIAPEMGRTKIRHRKRNKITFFYRFPDEILCNESFLAGDIIVPTTDTYEIDCWTLYKTSLGSPVAGTAQWYRKEELDADLNVTDTYAVIEYAASTLHYMKSQGIVLNANDRVNISFDYRDGTVTSTGTANVLVAYVLFETATAKYTLDDDGSWNLAGGAYASNVKNLNISYSTLESLGDWKNKLVESKAVPGNGTLYICLVNNSSPVNRKAEFKGLDIVIKEKSKQPGVIGDYDQYTKTQFNNQDFTEEIFMDDSNNRSHKGALFFDGDLTGDRWYRGDFNTERLTFKREKAIAHMLLNRRNRDIITVNMLGLSWNDDSAVKPIGLMNRFKFVDDAPTKVFMIVNLGEMDFSAARWQATMIEIFDTAIDDNDPALYPDHSFANIYQKDV